MKIGFDATTAFTGTSNYYTYSKSVIHLLAQYHPDNFYVLYTSRLKKDPSLQALLSPKHLEVRTPAFIVSKMNMGNLWRSTILGNTALHDKVDVFHGLNNELPFVLSKKLSTVVTIHNLNYIRYPHLFNPLEIEIYKRRYKHASKVANKIVATSKQTAEDLHYFLGISLDKIVVIYETCHPAFKKEYPPFELTRLCDEKKLPQDFILVSCSSDALDDNVLKTVKALVAIKDQVDIPLVVVGRPHKDYLLEIRKLAQQEQINDRLIILPDMSLKDRAKIFQLCKIYINASTYPCSSMSIKEALFSKVPIICSRIPEFIEAGGLAPLYVHPNNVGELAYTIQNILNNPSLTTNMIFQGEVHAREFDDQLVADQLNDVYKSLASQRSVQD